MPIVDLTFTETIEASQEGGKVTEYTIAGELSMSVDPPPADGHVFFRFTLLQEEHISKFQLNQKVWLRHYPSVLLLLPISLFCSRWFSGCTRFW